jgi:putative phage-type endonuclease
MTATIGFDLSALATPAAVCVYDGPPHTDAWHAARMEGITATDLVKIMGYSVYGNAVSVWADKLGRWDDHSGEAAWWGTALEPLVIRRWLERNSPADVRPIGVLANAHHPTHRASLDGIVVGCPDGDGPCGLQVKTRSAFKTSEWRADVPDDVYVQEQWEMHVTGYQHMHVAVLFDNHNLRTYRIDRDDEDIQILTVEADRVWEHVLADTQPDTIDNSLALTVLNRLYAAREGQIEMDPAQAAALLADLADAAEARRDARATVKAADADYDAAVARVVKHLGAAERVYVPDRAKPVFDYRLHERAGRWQGPYSYRQLEFDEAFLSSSLAQEPTTQPREQE